MAGNEHRSPGFQLLRGNGLEIGAFHQPAPVPEQCTVHYGDVRPKTESIKNFPELNVDDLVDIEYICDLDRDGLEQFRRGQFDFVILNHVIEHIANPIKIVRELFRITAVGGHVVLSAPDKEFTFDKDRALTPFSHLLDEYRRDVVEITDDHYVDFLRGVHPEVFDNDPEYIQATVDRVRERREHVHVWNSATFADFLEQSFAELNIEATCCFESRGRANAFEYFSVWRKTGEGGAPARSAYRAMLGKILSPLRKK